jgi:hypothetical protein
MELSEKQKMLGAALFMHHVKKETAVYVLLLLSNPDDIDDMTWYMREHPKASDDELVAVASQLDKERKQGSK